MKKLLLLLIIPFLSFGQCDVNENQAPFLADPNESYDIQLIDGEISFPPLVAGYDTLTAFPNAIEGQFDEAVVGIRIPNDTSFVYELNPGEPQLFENVQINSISINSVQILESTNGITDLPPGFYWSCVNGGPDGNSSISECVWNGGDYGCISFGFESEVPYGYEGAYRLNVLLDVVATYELFPGVPIPIDITVDDLFNYYVLVIDSFEPLYGCTDPAADNYNPNANSDDGSCIYDCTMMDTSNGSCYWYVYVFQGGGQYTTEDAIDLGLDCSCVDELIIDCTDDTACNYNPQADISDDNLCTFTTPCFGCMYESACNYTPNATNDNGSCIMPDICGSCSSSSTCFGCTYESACNYSALALYDDDSCVFADEENCQVCSGTQIVSSDSDNDGLCDANDICPGYDDNLDTDLDGVPDGCDICPGYDDNFDTDLDGVPDGCDICPIDSLNDIDSDGLCANEEVYGCMYESACNYNPNATEDNQSCIFSLECEGCTDSTACNYSPTVSITNNDICQYDSECGLGCNPNNNCYGCTDSLGCNYNMDAIDDDGSCEYTSCYGCIDSEAYNYNPSASQSDNSCYYNPGCTNSDYVEYDETSDYDDGSCITLIIYGCTDTSALNYNVEAYENDGTCVYECYEYNIDTSENSCYYWVWLYEDGGQYDVEIMSLTGYDCTCVVNFDLSVVYGCTDDTACNFDPLANTPNGCDYACYDCCGIPNGDGTTCDGDCGNCNDDTSCLDECGVPNGDNSCYGCIDPQACDYDPDATIAVECDYSCWGCMDSTACNYDPNATFDPNGLICEFISCADCIWESDFSDSSDWIIDHDENDCSLDWEIGENLECGGFYPISPIESDNGFYAMIDSDEYGSEEGGTETEDSWLTMASAIDCSGYENVIVEFDTWYRAWYEEKCWLVVSTDGTFPTDLTPYSEADPANGIYEIFPGISGYGGAEVASNPTRQRINISEAAGGASQVWIRFNWTGTWGYAWFIDRVCIAQQPADDITLSYGRINQNGTNQEYGRIPVAQLGDDFFSAAAVYNFGVNEAENVTLSMELVNSMNAPVASQTDYSMHEFNSEEGSPLQPDTTYTISGPIPSDESVYFQGAIPVQTEMLADVYTATFTVSSSGDSEGGDYFSDNTAVREFEITENLYSIDGIDVYSNPSVTRMGTGSFTDATDGFMMMSYYDLAEGTNVVGATIMLDSYAYSVPLTVPGGELVVAIRDTSFITDDENFNPGDVIASSDFHLVTQGDIDNGFITVPFSSPEYLSSGAYFISVEMYSNGDETPIWILDDETIPQPSYMSMIYIPGDPVYSNGTAAAIRMITGDSTELDIVFGCTDPLACNYDENANTDNGSCINPNVCGNCDEDFSCFGCTDPLACNHNQFATIDDNSCVYGICFMCDVNPNQTDFVSDPEGSYDVQLINGSFALNPLIVGYDTLTAFPNATEGELYEAVVGVRIPNDTSFTYELTPGDPQVFENMQINSMSINSVQILESTNGITDLPPGFYWSCVNGGPDGNSSSSECVWNGGDYGCISFGFESEVPSGYEGAYRLNVLLDVVATYDLLPGVPIPIEITVEDLLDYYVLVIDSDENLLDSGCTDSTACNYDALATYDDGSCEFINVTLSSSVECPLAYLAVVSGPFGGVPPYTYNWYYDIDNNGLDIQMDPLVYENEMYIAVEENGTYYIVVTDSGSCSYIESINLNTSTCNAPWTPPTTYTDCNATLGLTSDSNITIDDNPITVGDWIGVFYTDLSGELACGGSGVWTGDPLSIAIWGDDVGTQDIKEGFSIGEPLTWMIWDNETDEIMTNVAVEYLYGSESFSCNALLQVEIASYSTITQNIILPENWFMFSTYVDPEDSNMESVIAPVVNNTEIVKNYSGDVYWPLLGINSIGNIVSGQGYQIKMNASDVLTIEGTEIPSDYSINLPESWSMVGYLHKEPANTIDMMSPIVEDLVIVKSYDGNVYWPELGINSIGDMNPGWGYQIKTESALTFNYPDIESGRLGFSSEDFVSIKFNKPINTGNNMTLGIAEDAWTNKPEEGDEIVVYDQEGLLVGNNRYRTAGSFVTIWGDDKTTREKDGLYVGEKFDIKLFRNHVSILEDITINSWEQGSGSYNINGISIAGSISSNIIEEKQLIKVTDIIGREVTNNTQQSTLFYIYNDGTVERKYIIK